MSISHSHANRMRKLKRSGNTDDVYQIAEELDLSIAEARLLAATPAHIDSLDDEQNQNIYEMIPADDTNTRQTEERVVVDDLLDRIPGLNALAIRLHYGIGDIGEMSLREVALQLGITAGQAQLLVRQGLAMMKRAILKERSA